MLGLKQHRQRKFPVCIHSIRYIENYRGVLFAGLLKSEYQVEAFLGASPKCYLAFNFKDFKEMESLFLKLRESSVETVWPPTKSMIFQEQEGSGGEKEY